MPNSNLKRVAETAVAVGILLAGAACFAQVDPSSAAHKGVSNILGASILVAGATGAATAPQQMSAGALPSLSKGKTNTPSEQFVLSSIQAGKEADLTRLSDRRLSASFVNTLLFRTAAAAVPSKIITIRSAEIVGDLEMPFGSPAVSNMIVFDQCDFEGRVALGGGRFDQSLIFQNSLFASDLLLDSAQIKGDFLLEHNKFEEGSDFDLSLTHVDGGVQIIDDLLSHINSAGLVAHSFILRIPSGYHVAHVSLLQSETDLLNIYAEPPDPKTPPNLDIEKLDLSKAKVKDQFSAHDVRVGTLVADGLQSTGFTVFGPDIPISNQLHLSDAQLGFFSWVKQKSMPWPIDLSISGLTFQDLDVSESGAEPDSENLQFLLVAMSSESAYTTYEAALRRLGRISEADEVYKSMRAKRRLEAFQHARRNPSELFSVFIFVLVDWIQSVFLGYGRFPLPPALWSLGIVLLGAFLFAKSRMQPAPKSEVDPDTYSRFWYSLELFLPVVDLGVAKGFRPRHQSRKLLAYARMHQLAGWVLIPVALAALTGAIK